MGAIDAPIIGGGFGSQRIGGGATEATFDNFRLIEKVGDVGDTWY